MPTEQELAQLGLTLDNWDNASIAQKLSIQKALTPQAVASGGLTAAQQATQARQAEQDRLAQEQQGLDNWWRREQWTNEQHQWNANDEFKKAQFEYQKAIDKRDFEAAQFWQERAYEIQRNTLTQSAQRDLQAMRGPDSAVDYWYASRGMTTPRGAESIKYEDAIPAWAKPVTYGSVQSGNRESVAPAPMQQAPAPVVQAKPQVVDLDETASFSKPVGTTAPAWATNNIAPDAKLAEYGGQPISLSNWAVEQLAKAPAWAGAK